MDINCGSNMNSTHVLRALRDGTLTEDVLDVALARLIKVQMRLGFFNNVEQLPAFARYNRQPHAYINTLAHQRLAEEGAAQGVVLLKNLNATLPLSFSLGGRLAVIGPNAQMTTELKGSYAMNSGGGVRILSPLEALSAHMPAGSVDYAEGVPLCRGIGTWQGLTEQTVCNESATAKAITAAGIKAAAALAGAASAVVLVLGHQQSVDGAEGTDRITIGLPGAQDELIAAVAAASAQPVTVVSITGESVDLAAAKANPKVGSILWQAYPGQAGAVALARAVFGLDNPAGRLPISLYSRGYEQQLSMSDMAMRPDVARGYPGRTYRFFDRPSLVVYEFGVGLSFTTFDHARVGATVVASVALPHYRPRGLAAGASGGNPAVHTVSVRVTNTGARAGAQSVLCFASPPGAGVGGKPLRKLVDFGRTAVLQPGASEVVSCNAPARAFAEPLPGSGDLEVVHGAWRMQLGRIEFSVVVTVQDAAVQPQEEGV